MAMAQANAPAEIVPVSDVQTDSQMRSNFLASRSQSDMLATDLIGHDVYARRTAAHAQGTGTGVTNGGVAGTDATGTQTTDTTTDTTMGTTTGTMTGNTATDLANTDSTSTGMPMTTMIAMDLDTMDNVGQINDIILSADGKVQALVIGVGGFIGVGEQDVAVMLNQVSFATDATNPAEMYVVLNTSGDLLKTSPAFDRTATMDQTNGSTDAAVTETGTTADTAMGTTADRERLTAPALEREGYAPVAVGDVSIEMLIGKSVYGADDSDVGTVTDVIVDDAGAVKDVIIDFGGFLGMGATQVALSFEELTILTDGKADIRVHVDATKEQVQGMPTYTPVN